jgi:hypothetical protein
MYNPKQVIIGRILEATALLMSLVWSTGVPDKQRQWVTSVHTGMQGQQDQR